MILTILIGDCPPSDVTSSSLLPWKDAALRYGTAQVFLLL